MRINELARDLEVKAKAILDYLAEIGLEDKKSHSSAIEDDLAEKIKAHFQEAEKSPQPAVEAEPAEKAPSEVAAPAAPKPGVEAEAKAAPARTAT